MDLVRCVDLDVLQMYRSSSPMDNEDQENENEDLENIGVNRKEGTVVCSAEDRRYCSICFDRLIKSARDGKDGRNVTEDVAREKELDDDGTRVEMEMDASLPVEPIAECDACLSLSHMTCLAKMSLTEHATSTYQLIPTAASCPVCDAERSWANIVKSCSQIDTT